MSELRPVLAKLNKFLNIRDSSDMIRQLLSPSIQGAAAEGVDDYETNLSKMIESLLSIQGTAQTTETMVKAIDEYVASSNDKLATELKDAPSESSSPAFHITQYNKAENAAGYKRNKSVCDIIGDTPAESGQPAHGKTLSVIEISDVRLNFNNRDCSAVSSFLQVLPSIEVSRAVPYFDCKIITSVSKGSEDEKITTDKLFANGVSIGKFLGGKVTEGNNTLESKYLMARITSEDTVDKNVLNNLEKKKPSAIASTASMELFTTPQTLVQGNSTFTDLDATSKGIQEGTKIDDDKLIMDKFRPLMTWESFNLTVAPASGLISTKTADVKIKLHDRSRMNEIAPLLVPARTGDTELHITWGWSHPDNDPNKNVYGALIDQMKVSEIYGVMNSSYSFTPEGQVDITLKLYTKGAQNVAFDLIKGNPKKASSTSDTLNKVVSAMREAIADLRGEGFNLKKDLGAPDTLSKATSTKGLLSLSEEEIKELQAFIKELNSHKKSKGTFDKFTKSFDAAVSETQSFSNQQTQYISDMIKKMMTGDDPYLATPEVGIKGKITEISHQTHVSFAKFLLYMVGPSLLHTGRYDDIQFVFYPMNENSMWARNYNIGQYPLNKDVLDGLFKEEFAKRPTMRIQTLLNLVRKHFMNDVGDDIYGFSRIYSDKNKKDEKKTQTAEQERKEKQKIAIEKQEIMKACYGDGDRKFKKPNISMFIESVKDENGKTVLRLHFTDRNCTSYSSYTDLWSTRTQSSLGVIGKKKRLQFKTSKKKPNGLSKEAEKKWEQDLEKNKLRLNNHNDPYNEAIEYFKEMGILKPLNDGDKYRVDVTPNKLRGIMASNMPTLKYGTEFSGILAANLSTQSNPQMESIHMVRQKRGNQPATPGDDGMPLRVRPSQLSLDTFGCPLVNFGQQFFVDFNTNSTIDDVYAVTGVSHSISPGDFKSSIKMVPLQKFGQFSSLKDTLDTIQSVADDATKS